MVNVLVKLLLTKWIELKSDGDRKIELLSELELSDKFRYLLGKPSKGDNILAIEFYSPNRIEYSVNLNELIK